MHHFHAIDRDDRRNSMLTAKWRTTPIGMASPFRVCSSNSRRLSASTVCLTMSLIGIANQEVWSVAT
eukprot:scaffold516993_cov19-Prasinocladus_malaysianus.AAC.1